MRAKTWIPVVALAGLGAVLTRPGTPFGGRARRLLHRTSRTARKRANDLKGRTRGLLYRARDQHPDPDVPDLVLADRIRSQLGLLERELDLPRIHVAVYDHVAHLHGVVSSPADITTLEDAVLSISGVREVESALHIGLSVSDTRPSVGRRQHDLQWSDAKRRLVDVVMQRGIDEEAALVLLNAVMETFAERLPDGERAHVAAHLPADVKAMFTVPERHHLHRQHHLEGFVNEVGFRSALGLGDHLIADVIADVLHALRELVPDEAEDVAAVLSAELRAIW